MTISSSNYIARYYKWIYNELPMDFCTLFWGSLFIVLCAPFIVIGKLLTSKRGAIKEYFWGGVFFWICLFALALFGFAFMRDALKMSTGNFLLDIVIGILGVILFAGAVISVLAIGVGTIYIADKGVKKWKESHDKDEQSQLSVWIGAIRQKHCTKINWE